MSFREEGKPNALLGNVSHITADVCSLLSVGKQHWRALRSEAATIGPKPFSHTSPASHGAQGTATRVPPCILQEHGLMLGNPAPASPGPGWG